MKRFVSFVLCLALAATLALTASAAAEPVVLEPELGEFLLAYIGHYDERIIYKDPDGRYYGFLQNYLDDSPVWNAVSGSTVSVSASSYLPRYEYIYYLPGNVLDHDRDTVWVENAEGYGVGEYLDLSYSYDARKEGCRFEYLTLCIVNGYAQADWKWQANSRVKVLNLFVNGEYLGRLNLADTEKPQYFDISGFELSTQSGEKICFRFEIADIYPGTIYQDTCITGIEMEFQAVND